MATILVSLSGEGRGHATRVRALIERLRSAHDLTIFAPQEAYAFLAPLYSQSEVEVRRIAGLRFYYTPKRRLDFRRTALAAASYLRRLPVLTSMLTRAVEEERPDLVLTDFEPALPRVARRLGVPFLSIDHQHFLTTYDLSSLPLGLRLHAGYMAAIVRGYFSGQEETVVSSFFFPPLRPSARFGVTQVGVMLRPDFARVVPESRDYLVAYWRRFAGDHVLHALESAGREVRIYGLGERPSRGNLRFLPIDEARFLEDLAQSQALICTAGNQLVGEALYLGKPVLALPEARNFEQYINAHFLRRSGAGDSVELERLSPATLQHFLQRVDSGDFRLSMPRAQLDGVPATLAAISRHLPHPRDPRIPASVFGPFIPSPSPS